jgi:hypothetical protein
MKGERSIKEEVSMADQDRSVDGDKQKNKQSKADF